MAAPDIARRTIALVNLAHGLAQFVQLILPTAVIAIADTRISVPTDNDFDFDDGDFISWPGTGLTALAPPIKWGASNQVPHLFRPGFRAM